MRLAEITDADPLLAQIARHFERHYAELFDDLFRRLAADPPPGWRVDVRRRWAVIDPTVYGLRETGPGTTATATRAEIERLLGEHGWRLADWRRGFVEREVERTRPDTGERIRRTERRRLVPMLRELARDERIPAAEVARLVQAFEQDPTRRGASAERQGRRQVLVLTADPREVTHMSTRRGWASCRSLDPDTTTEDDLDHVAASVECDLGAGTVMIWVTRASELDDPGSFRDD